MPCVSSPQPSIFPSMAHLDPGSTQSFHLRQPAATGEVQWSVEGIPGGDDKVGRITLQGRYKAPHTAPRPNQIHIQAKFHGPDVRYAWATVVVGPKSPDYAYVGFWDRKGEGEGRLLEAHGIELEPSGTLLIADPIRSAVLRFTTQGRFVGTIGRGRGAELGQLDGPRDIKADGSGRIFVADGNNNRIQVFSKKGELLRAWGKKGPSAGELQRPHSLAIGRDETVFVADVDNSRVVVFGPDGRYIRAWGKRGSAPGEFLAPHGVATDANGDVFVVEYDGRCQKFTASGKFLFAFANAPAQNGGTHGYHRYHTMSSDRWGDIYLMARDTRENSAVSIDKYNNSGDLVARFALPPSESRRLGGQAAAIAPNGRVYAADTESGHAGVSIFDPI